MDEFLEVGACNDQELVKFVVDRLLKGLAVRNQYSESGMFYISGEK